MAWGYYLLYSLFAVESYNTALSYCKGNFSHLPGRDGRGGEKQEGEKGSESSY